jgi:hypothetical protein
MKAVELSASANLLEKRVAYLCAGLCFAPDHEFRMMLVNRIQRDLKSPNVLEVSIALPAAAKILTVDMIPAVLDPLVTGLLKHDQPIVAANCARRRMPTGPTAQNYDAEGKRQAVYTMPESTGLEEVGSIGTGIMLIKREVFEGMSEPWFDMPWQTSRGYMGEDVFFCKKAQELGYKIYIDHDVSKEIGHIGTFEFRHDHTWIVKEEMEKEAQ